MSTPLAVPIVVGIWKFCVESGFHVISRINTFGNDFNIGGGPFHIHLVHLPSACTVTVKTFTSHQIIFDKFKPIEYPVVRLYHPVGRVGHVSFPNISYSSHTMLRSPQIAPKPAVFACLGVSTSVPTNLHYPEVIIESYFPEQAVTG